MIVLLLFAFGVVVQEAGVTWPWWLVLDLMAGCIAACVYIEWWLSEPGKETP